MPFSWTMNAAPAPPICVCAIAATATTTTRSIAHSIVHDFHEHEEEEEEEEEEEDGDPPPASSARDPDPGVAGVDGEAPPKIDDDASASFRALSLTNLSTVSTSLRRFSKFAMSSLLKRTLR